MPGLVHIVDDDTSFRIAMERRLKKAGYEVAIYPSAQDLLDRLPTESESGCILLDVRIRGGPPVEERSRRPSAAPGVGAQFLQRPWTVNALANHWRSIRIDRTSMRLLVRSANSGLPSHASADGAAGLADGGSCHAYAIDARSAWTAAGGNLRHHVVELRKRRGCHALRRSCNQ